MNKGSQMDRITISTTWRELTPGGEIYASGNSEQFCTGDWRTAIPTWNSDKCKQCLLCFPVCPDSSIPVTGNKREDFDFEHCKGCGICFKVCPFDAISFHSEGVEVKK